MSGQWDRRRFLALLGAGAGSLALPPVRSARRGSSDRVDLQNGAFKLSVRVAEGEVRCTLEDSKTGFAWCHGPYLYHACTGEEGNAAVSNGLVSPSVWKDGNTAGITGKLAGLTVSHELELSRHRPVLTQRMLLKNTSAETISLTAFDTGFQRRVADASGKPLDALARNRFVAIPFRHRAEDPPELDHDFPVGRIHEREGFVYTPQSTWSRPKRVPSDRHFSEGWAWTRADCCLGIFSYSQQNLVFSTLSSKQTERGIILAFGGTSLLPTGPSAVREIAPGETVDLGETQYRRITGGFKEAMYAYRSMLDEKGCRFPPNYNPPVHWNQLYNMEGAWNNRDQRYTRERLHEEAAKARAYGCESLYLDPGWDTTFGSFIWDRDRLGPFGNFARDMREKYGLDISLHCPMPPWASSPGMAMGPSPVDEWPDSTRRHFPAEESSPARIPAVVDGHRNLSLLPEANARASSCIPGYAIHSISHLNDGYQGNSNSWIAGELPAWAEIDLGDSYKVSHVRLSNAALGQYEDRQPATYRILVRTDSDSDWRQVARRRQDPFQGTRNHSFVPVEARRVRVEISETADGDLPRLDEIEIYEARKLSKDEAEAFRNRARRGEAPAPRGPRICMGAKQFRREAEERLSHLCRNGAAFLMFDGTWWNGPCDDPRHGHPVPYRTDDHIDSCLDMARRIKKDHPDVLIEMHDMLAGGAPMRMTPVYYKYGLPGSYDDNWGLELMWNPLADLKERRALALYYYNLSCNIPLYLHVDLRKDNRHCIVLWYYASTCRHLGIGGSHEDPEVAEKQKAAMQQYRRLESFYKRGEFYGTGPHLHFHALPEQQSFVANIFNLSDEERLVTGEMPLREMGLEPTESRESSAEWANLENGTFRAEVKMPPWSADVTVCRLTRER